MLARLLIHIADSTMGKLMEKAGGLMGNKGMEQKGAEKRNQAGGGYGDNNNDY